MLHRRSIDQVEIKEKDDEFPLFDVQIVYAFIFVKTG